MQPGADEGTATLQHRCSSLQRFSSSSRGWGLCRYIPVCSSSSSSARAASLNVPRFCSANTEGERDRCPFKTSHGSGFHIAHPVRENCVTHTVRHVCFPAEALFATIALTIH